MSDAGSMDAPARWFTEFEDGHSERYVQRFRSLAAEGTDVAGEGRLVDALVPRRARILDAGCGPGRVGAALHASGHEVVGVDLDPVLIAAARADHPGIRWELGDLAHLSADGLGGAFDAVVLAGNVMVYVVPGGEAAVLLSVAGLLEPDGVVVAGFATDRDYGVAAFDRDCAAAGLRLEHRFATWDLRPWHADADWVVSVLRRP